MDTIGDKLREYFKNEGITQEQIATQTGVSQAYINVLLNNKKQFGKKQAQKWADIFGISPQWLLTGEGEMLKPSEVKKEASPSGDVFMSREVFDQISRLTETVLSQQKTIEFLSREKTDTAVSAQTVNAG